MQQEKEEQAAGQQPVPPGESSLESADGIEEKQPQQHETASADGSEPRNTGPRYTGPRDTGPGLQQKQGKKGAEKQPQELGGVKEQLQQVAAQDELQDRLDSQKQQQQQQYAIKDGQQQEAYQDTQLQQEQQQQQQGQQRQKSQVQAEQQGSLLVLDDDSTLAHKVAPGPAATDMQRPALSTSGAPGPAIAAHQSQAAHVQLLDGQLPHCSVPGFQQDGQAGTGDMQTCELTEQSLLTVRNRYGDTDGAALQPDMQCGSNGAPDLLCCPLTKVSGSTAAS